MSKIRIALLFSSGSLYIYQVLNLLFSMYIARVLTPAEIGTYAIAAAIAMSSNEFKLLGTGDYLIREKINSTKIKNTLGLSILSSWGIAIILILAANPISEFYNTPPVEYLLYISSISFWLAPFSSINFALLHKEIDYKKNAIIGWSSRLSNFGTSFALLFLGYSYYSLAIGVAVGAIVEFSLTLVFRSKQMEFIPLFNNIKSIFKFGSINTVTNIASQQAKLSFDLIIGRIGTTTDIAFFSRGNGLVDFIAHIILGGLQSIALPYLSANNDKTDDLRHAYLKSSNLALSLLLPILTVAGLLSYEIIYVLFGKQWESSSQLVPFLILWYLLSNLHPFARQVIIAARMEKQFMMLQIVNLIAVVSSILLLYPSGLLTLSHGLVGVGVLYLILISVMIKQCLNLTLNSYILAMKNNFFIAFICGSITLLISNGFLNDASPIWIIITVAVLLPITWFLTVKYLKHEIHDEIVMLINSKRNLNGK